MSADVVVRGPLFHQSHQLLAELETELAAAVGKAAELVVQANLGGSLRHPSGRYQAHVHVQHDGPGTDSVVDDGIVYGPWLEGVSSRNQSTRFKGYAAFRRAAQAVDAKVPLLAEPVLAAAVERFNR